MSELQANDCMKVGVEQITLFNEQMTLSHSGLYMTSAILTVTPPNHDKPIIDLDAYKTLLASEDGQGKTFLLCQAQAESYFNVGLRR